jgi:hypothetical protein
MDTGPLGRQVLMEYLIKWRGYPVSDVTWELKQSLCHALDVVLNYEEGLEG